MRLNCVAKRSKASSVNLRTETPMEAKEDFHYVHLMKAGYAELVSSNIHARAKRIAEAKELLKR